MHTPRLRFIGAAAILALFIFGCAAAAAVPFHGINITIADAVRHVWAHAVNLTSASIMNARVAALLMIALLPAALHGWFWKRHALAAHIAAWAAFLLPLAMLTAFAGLGGAAMWFLTPVLVPVLTVGMFIGLIGLNGETWSEGMVAFAAAGWWSILWGGVLIYESVKHLYAVRVSDFTPGPEVRRSLP